MTDRQLLENLQDVVARLGIETQRVSGDAPSGLCRLANRQVLMWNSTLPVGRQVAQLCRELSRVDLSRVYIVPAVREKIEGQAAPRQ